MQDALHTAAARCRAASSTPRRSWSRQSNGAVDSAGIFSGAGLSSWLVSWFASVADAMPLRKRKADTRVRAGVIKSGADEEVPEGSHTCMLPVVTNCENRRRRTHNL